MESTTEVQEVNEETTEYAKAVFFTIFSFLNTTVVTGQDKNKKPITRKRLTLLNRLTAEHKPNPVLAAQLAMNAVLNATAAHREAERAKLAKADEERREAEKANRVQIDPIAAMTARFEKLLKVDDKA